MTAPGSLFQLSPKYLQLNASKEKTKRGYFHLDAWRAEGVRESPKNLGKKGPVWEIRPPKEEDGKSFQGLLKAVKGWWQN